MTGLPPLASLVEFSRRQGRVLAVGEPDGARAVAALADASALVRAEAGRTWVADDGQLEAVPGDITAVVMQAARRGWANPQGYTSETLADYTWRLDSGRDGGTYLTDHERDICRRYRGTAGVWTLPMTRGYDDLTVYAPVSGGGDLLPLLHPDDLT